MYLETDVVIIKNHNLIISLETNYGIRKTIKGSEQITN